MKAIEIDSRPKTGAGLRRDLGAIGVQPGMTLMVHSSLSSIGWVVGGAQTVVRALLDSLGDRGTLAMPAATPQCADPADWSNPKVSNAWLDEVRDHLPLFDSETTPCAMGAIPESFRTWPGTLRSDHPLESVCARGPMATEMTREHSLSFSEGPGTPFEKLHALDGWVLLLGVGFNRCTALHFAESLLDKRRTKTSRFPLMKEGSRVWVEVPDVADDNDTHFPIVGERFLSSGRARRAPVGEAASILFPVRELVAFAGLYFEEVL